MFKLTKPLFLHCQTPTHVGSGSDLGIIDSPIQREGHTQFPKFESSSLKGALRQRFEEVYHNFTAHQSERVKIHLTFGYDDNSENKDIEVQKVIKDKFTGNKNGTFEQQYAGALGFTDARLLFFPVKSMSGVFALVTCPYILEKFAEELTLTSSNDTTWNSKVTELNKLVKELDVNSLEAGTDEGFCYTNSSTLKISNQDAIVLEEYAFTIIENDFSKPEADKTSKLDKLITALTKIVKIDSSKIVILHNDDFVDFVTLHTEVITRNKIGENGVVVGGALFTEEFLPAESILYSLVMASPIFQTKESEFTSKDEVSEEENVMSFFTETISNSEKAKGIFQIGGNSSLGKGIVKMYS
jgi:CRISPR-associated protein Cmr4